ncbi:serine protease inhibitor Cvsi-1-like [Crassostrea angulata]|uniref:Uncharacterized protein n=1 Tax=Magallana gigas TaxID=29159 RepID=A0A8W8J336_MAGGI|nr:serine protease inhibitor Cvsi-1-like [Crassostrea gigas]XP_052711610.1 serine protease inhibitor Cvsi-1-like [Crassostrea angulata]
MVSYNPLGLNRTLIPLQNSEFCQTVTMKSVVLGALAIFAVSVYAEYCRDGRDCSITICPSNSSHIACHGGRCTCDAFTPCSDITDCLNLGRCRDHDRHYHCLDSECTCLKDEDIPH